MKIIFNDATEITVQQVESHGNYLCVLTIGNTPEQLKVLFTDTSRTSKIIVKERGQTVATYEGYTAFYRTEIYTGKIYGVVMYKPEKTPEVQSSMVQAAVTVAQIQAQSLTDEQAREMLRKKWIEKLTELLHSLPDKLINTLAARVQALSEKYAVTFASVEDEIRQTEQELSAMIDDLTGSDFDMQGLKELQALLGGV